MKQKIRFTFLGGDNRQKQAISILAQDGFRINVLGWKDILHENVRIFETLDMELFDCDVLMLPIPYGNPSGGIHITGLDADLKLEPLMRNLKSGTVVIFGKEDEVFSEAAGKFPISCYDILKEESFSVRNAVPTAEGAIQRAMTSLFTKQTC